MTSPTPPPHLLTDADADAVTFVPGDPPRTGHLAIYRPAPGETAPSRYPDKIDVVLPTATGTSVRRRTVAARLVPVADALAVLGRVGPAAGSPSDDEPDNGLLID